MSELLCQSWSHAPLPFFVPSEFAALVYSTDFVTFFFLGERTIIVKEDSIQAQLDGPISFSGLLTGIWMIDSCNWEQHNSLGEDSWKHRYMFEETLLISMYGLSNLWKGSSVVNFRVLYLLMKQDINSKLSSSDWPRNEIKGDQGPWSGRKVTDGCCLFS